MSLRSLRLKLSVHNTTAALALLPALALGAFAPAAQALQPLQVFLEGAQKANVDLLEATANANQQDALASVQLGRALPGIQLRGTYTHNQYDAVFAMPAFGNVPAATYTIQPYDELDLYATLNVPLVDLAQFKRISAARRGTEQTRKQIEATQLQVAGQVAQDYYQLVANLALVEASKRQIDVAQKSLALAQDKFALGSSPELDVDRAKSEVERQVQQLANAQLQQAVAQRALTSATGISPDVAGSSDFSEDLHEEAALDDLEKSIGGLPQVQAANLGVQSAEASSTAQKYTLIPALAAQFTEHVTNYSGFVGSDAAYQFVLSLTWAFDFTTVANIHAQEAAADAARAREQRARLQAGDAISNDWNSVKAALARSQSARVEVKTSAHAADLAMDRYKNGAATQLDLLQAQRDAFSAEVARIQADADLANARAQLQLSVGQNLDRAASGVTPAPAK